jgi:hypothetical protein
MMKRMRKGKSEEKSQKMSITFGQKYKNLRKLPSITILLRNFLTLKYAF